MHTCRRRISSTCQKRIVSDLMSAATHVQSLLRRSLSTNNASYWGHLYSPDKQHQIPQDLLINSSSLLVG